MHTTYLLTGSNMGDSLANLNRARLIIEKKVGEIKKISSVYKTEPWGNRDQQSFFNEVLKVHTELEPDSLLKTILEIEKEMGRSRNIKWEPRIIDIDILFFDDLISDSIDLKIPHPLLQERRFTLVPMNEVASEFIHPVFKKSISRLLSECSDTGNVEKL
ncbi:MAG: 2-amino-4-hydroxy-6-hydroxymethyldihydropteridine diphosphokinase [Bacteroidia bacterium]